MKKVFRCVFIIAASLMYFNQLCPASGWVRVVSPTAQTLDHCFFVNDNIGWLAGDSGTIIKTFDAGKSWTVQNTGINNKISSIYFLNERLGWAVAWNIHPDSLSYMGTIILKTVNGGLNWTRSMYPDTNTFMTTIYFLDSLRGFAAGTPIIIAHTTNGGISWVKTDTDTTLKFGLPVYNLKFYNSEIAYACGGFRDIAGAMWTTTNGGLNWRATLVSPEPLVDIYIINPGKAIAVGGDFEYGSSYVRSTDFGLSWFYHKLGTLGIARSIDFRTKSEVWVAVGIAQKFVYSLDTGNTWTSIYTPDSVSINDIDFTDSLHGWAVGNNGALLRYDGTIVINSEIIQSQTPGSFILQQNYPNPFNPKTIIKYYIPAKVSDFKTLVRLKIYDVSGKEIAVLVNELQIAGSYTVEFNGKDLPSGIYFYELTAGGFSNTRKMLLIK